MDNVLLVTPLWPPTPGGPATHAKKLSEHFHVSLVNFETYKNLPSGVRHFCVFVKILKKAMHKRVIYALDGFTIALPSIIAGKILRKKVMLRIGGDFIYENFLYTKEVSYEDFYKNFKEYKKLFPKKLYIKYLFQKFILEHAEGIIFNTEWQKNIFEKHYNLTGTELFVVINPIDEIKKEVYMHEKAKDYKKFLFTSITRDIPYKNLERLREAIKIAQRVNGDIELDTTQGRWESCLKRISLSRGYVCASISDISPNQVLEAVVLKVPVIISKYTGLTEIIEKSNLGMVIDPFNVGDMEKAILNLCNQEVYEKFQNNLENFSWPQTWEKYFVQTERILKEFGNN